MKHIIPTQQELKVLIKYREIAREKRRRFFNILKDSLKPLYLFLIGIPIAAIFYLAQLRILDKFPSSEMTAILSIFLFFLYGCILHDLMIPYLHNNKNTREVK